MLVASSLHDKLTTFNQVLVIEPFRQIQQSEDAADILSGHNERTKAAILDVMDVRAAFLNDVLMPYASGLGEHTVHQLAVGYTKAVSGLKNAVRSVDELEAACEVQSMMLCAFLTTD